jgi:periplasmic copper chaperone A
MTDRTCLRLTRRLLVTAALAVGLVVAGAGVASAHITVSAPEATSGGSDAVITFRVPNESESARTVGLKVRLPTDTPIASVLVQPKVGWLVSVRQSKLSTPIKTDDGEITEAVSEITWRVSPAALGIGPGQFDEFVVIAGQLPEAKSLTFKAIQTYGDDSTVSWIEEPAPGSSAEPEHPAPVLTLGGAASKPEASSTAASHPATDAADSSDAASKATGITGIVLGGLGVLLGFAALAVALRRRRA